MNITYLTHSHRQIQGDFCCVYFEIKVEIQLLNQCEALGGHPRERGAGSPQSHSCTSFLLSCLSQI